MPGTDRLAELLEKAEIQYHRGSYQEAIRLWEEALVLDPGNRRADEGRRMAQLLRDAGGPLSDRPAEPPAAGVGTGPGGSGVEVPPRGKPFQEAVDRSLTLDPERRPPGDVGGDGRAPGRSEGNPSGRQVSPPVPPPSEGGREASGGGPDLEEIKHHFVEGDFQLAKKTCESYLAIHPGNEDAEVLLQVLEQSVEADRTIQAHVSRGWECWKAGDREGAARECQEALVINGSHPGALELHQAISKEEPVPTPGEQEAPERGTQPVVSELAEGSGTRYGQWVDEFSSLDLDAARETVGKDPVPPPQEAPSPGTDAAPESCSGGSREFPHPEGESTIRLAFDSAPASGEAGDGPAGPGAAGDPGVPVEEAEYSETLLSATPPPPFPKGPFPARRVLAAGIVVLVAGMGGWFLLSRTGHSASREPAGAETTAPSTEPAPGPASSLPPSVSGKTDATGKETVKEIPLDGQPSGEGDSPSPAPPSPEGSAGEVADLVREGKKFYRRGLYRQALDMLGAAQALDPINFEIKDLLDEVNQKWEREKRDRRELEVARKAFESQDYENALRKLYRLPGGVDSAPNRTYIRNAWFNWGVQLLRAGNCPEARTRFDEVLGIEPDHTEAIKLRNIADRYTRQSKDRIFYSFVEQLELKAFDSP